MTTEVSITVDGRELAAPLGVPLGAILHKACGGVLRSTDVGGAPRGVFCGMGSCFDCLVTVDGRPGVRACMTPVVAGMRVDRNLR